MHRAQFKFGDRERQAAQALIALAISEDLSQAGDITSTSVIPGHARGVARVVARSAGVLAGIELVELLGAQSELSGLWEPCLNDGDVFEPGRLIGRVSGPMRSLLAMERTALNFLQRLSGIATLTARFVAEAAGTRARIFDTRKTTPGWRALEKYAVRCGGGCNHRFGLFDAILIKDNHLAWLASTALPGDPDPIVTAISAARRNTSTDTTVEVEVDSLDQLEIALECGPDIILVDNFPPEVVAEAVRRRDKLAPSIQLEASGGVNLAQVRALAQAGVDRISVGALTHSAPAIDLAFDFESMPVPNRAAETVAGKN